MLLAELRGKVHAFACPQCGAEVDPVAAAAIEDALTSYVFGAMRGLPPGLALAPLLAAATQDRFPGLADDDVEIEPWPFGTVDLIDIGGANLAPIGVEPDIKVSAPQALVCVEVKLGSQLGADPLQLPKEVLWAVKEAGDRPWLLLCITADAREPAIASFCADRERVVQGPALGVGAAVASYFATVKAIAPAVSWPSPTVVAANMKWMSWRTVGQVLTDAAARAGVPPPHRRQLEDVVSLLRSKGLAALPFHGFAFDHDPLPPYEPCWSPPPAPRGLWEGMGANDLPASAQRWLAAAEEGALWSRLVAPILPGFWGRVWGRTT